MNRQRIGRWLNHVLTRNSRHILPSRAWVACLCAAVLALPGQTKASDESLVPLSRRGTTHIPSYYQQLDFNLTSPSAWATAIGGYANPGAWTMLSNGEVEAFWTDPNLDAVNGWRRWGLFLGNRNIGFGTIYNRIPDPSGTGTLSVTDYRLSLSTGNRNMGLGVSYGWSGGDKDTFQHTQVLQVGAVQRWNRYLSTGATGVFSTEERDQTGLFDVGVRPLGDQRFTVFGDLELPRGLSLQDAPWSVGAMVEVPAGLRLIGRYYDDETWGVAVAYTLGGGVGTGHVRATGQARFNSENDVSHANYGVRIGFPERSFAGDRIEKDKNYLSMDLKGPVVHRRYRYFDRGNTLTGILTALEDAKTDSRVKGVALNLSGIQVSPGNAWEIREKLRELQKNGKHVVAFIDEADITIYHLASVADRIVMDPEGMMIIPGFVMGRTYLSAAMEKLGLGFDEWRFLKYKSAAEAYSRRSMSEADREQRQALVDGYYETTRAGVAEGRNVGPETFDRWVDEGTVVTPAMALKEGMVDTLGRWDEVKEVVKKLEGSGKSFVGADELAGSFYPSRRWGERPKIGLVYAIGACAMDSGIKARELSKLIDKLAGTRGVKAVVMRVNSPGGSALASDLVVESIRKCAKKKPVIVSQGDVAASGGYWVSMYANEIVVQPTTITGSIGVIGGWAWDAGFGEKFGLDGDFVKRGEHADILFGIKVPVIGASVPHRPLTTEERDRIIGEMREMYEGFVGKVAEGRKMTKEAVEAVAQGRVWTGSEGMALGLVDTLGGIETAIRIARERAGIDPDEEVELLDFKTEGLFDLSTLFESPFPSLPFRNAARAEGTEEPEPASLFDDYEMFYLREIIRNNGRPLCLVPPDLLPRRGPASSE